jgi:hypothetical protein
MHNFRFVKAENKIDEQAPGINTQANEDDPSHNTE